MANLTTQQVIKVKVNPLDGSLVPQNKQPVVLKNTVQETVGLEGLGNVNSGPTAPDAGGTLVYNPTTQLYDVRQLNFRDLGDLSGTPANNDLIFYSASSNSFYYAAGVSKVEDLVDVDITGRANGTVLTYDSTSNTYKHIAALTDQTRATLGSVTIGTSGVVIDSVSNFANTTQLGTNPTGSDSELVTAKAVMDYVTGVMAAAGGGGGGGIVELDGLLDVTIGATGFGLVNRQVLLYDGATNQWVNRAIRGTANNIVISGNANNDIVLSLANDVVVANSINVPTANIVTLVANTANVTSSATFNANVTIQNSLQVGNTFTVARQAGFGANVSIANTLTVNGNATFNGNTVANTLTIRANANVGQQLTANNLLASNAQIGKLETTGDVVFGNTSSTIVFDAVIDSDIIPAANNVYSLGSPTRRFKDLYLAATTLILGDTTLSAATGTFTIDTDAVINGVATFESDVEMQANLFVANASVLAGNVQLGASYGDIVQIHGGIDTNIMPSANDVYSIGNTTTRFAAMYAHNMHAVTGSFSGDVVVSGNLVVEGELTRISVNTMNVEDPLIQLSANNDADTVDIGFFGNYNDGAVGRYTGLFRDASDDGKWVLFANLHHTAYPSTTVLRTSPSFRLSTFVSYLESGGFRSDQYGISATANSTYSVEIVANTISLTSALDVESGGMGRRSLTQNAVLVGNGIEAVKQISGANMQVLSIVGGVPTFVSSLDAGEY